MSLHNLYALFGQIRSHELQEWSQAYHHYHALLSEVALSLSCPIGKVAGVMAALSPNNDYLGNLSNCIKTIQHHQASLPIQLLRVQTYGAKAWAILEGQDPDVTLSTAQKTRSFYHNLLEPDDISWVTVDRHIYCAWVNERIGIMTIKPLLYKEISEGIKVIAQRHSLVPSGVQSALWYAWRKRHGILKTDQGLFFREDLAIVRNTIDFTINNSTISR